MKPLGHKNYGSIPHLSSSRKGPGDHSCSPGQERIATVKPRDKFDKIIVSEKLDGSNCGVYLKDGRLIPLTRSGNIASNSKFEHHLEFAKWVQQNDERLRNILKEDERLIGEWLSHAHGTLYKLRHEPYVVFDIMIGQKRLLYEEIVERCIKANLTMPFVLNEGPISVSDALEILGDSGFHGADLAEGFVYKVERKDKVDFLVKYVRPEKVDGIYMSEGIKNERL